MSPSLWLNGNCSHFFTCCLHFPDQLLLVRAVIPVKVKEYGKLFRARGGQQVYVFFVPIFKTRKFSPPKGDFFLAPAEG